MLGPWFVTSAWTVNRLKGKPMKSPIVGSHHNLHQHLPHHSKLHCQVSTCKWKEMGPFQQGKSQHMHLPIPCAPIQAYQICKISYHQAHAADRRRMHHSIGSGSSVVGSLGRVHTSVTRANCREDPSHSITQPHIFSYLTIWNGEKCIDKFQS